MQLHYEIKCYNLDPKFLHDIIFFLFYFGFPYLLPFVFLLKYWYSTSYTWFYFFFSSSFYLISSNFNNWSRNFSNQKLTLLNSVAFRNPGQLCYGYENVIKVLLMRLCPTHCNDSRVAVSHQNKCVKNRIQQENINTSVWWASYNSIAQNQVYDKLFRTVPNKIK